MINKPINPSPCNSCVTTNSVNIKYEIPNAGVDGCVTMINELDTGNYVTVKRDNFSEQKQQISTTMGLMADTIITNQKEYSWNSFYWQTPTSDGNNEIVSGYNDNTNKLYLQANLGEPIQSVRPTYQESISIGEKDGYTVGAGCVYRCVEFSRSIYNHRNADGSGISCSSGQLSDYIGYMALATGWDSSSPLFSLIFDELKNGRTPILEFMGDDGKLITCCRVVAYNKTTYTFDEGGRGQYLYIVDNAEIANQINNAIETGRLETGIYYWKLNTLYDGDSFLKINQIKLYSSDATDYETDFSGQLMLYNGDYYYIKNSIFENFYHSLHTIPSLPKPYPGETVTLYDNTMAEFNTTPSYYFRVKKNMTTSVTSGSIKDGILDDTMATFETDLYWVDDTNTRRRPKMSHQYFSLYCQCEYDGYDKNNSLYDKYDWKLVERSPILSYGDTYEFDGFINGEKYQVRAVLVDADGDEYTAQNTFTAQYQIADIDIGAHFNSDTTSIDFSIESLLEPYHTCNILVYRVPKSRKKNLKMSLATSKNILCKAFNDVAFTNFSDYNICNNTYYDYYIRLLGVINEGYTGIKGIRILRVATDIKTDFKGTSILGLIQNDQKLGIEKSFNIMYQFDNNLGELTTEITHDYMNTFGKYPKELRGRQSYISGSLTGLLGNECNGDYKEPEDIRKEWNDFVNDDSIKLYRGFNGETMIISIDSSRVKPHYYPSAGIVNELSITFKEIADASNYAIFATSMAGD